MNHLDTDISNGPKSSSTKDLIDYISLFEDYLSSFLGQGEKFWSVRTAKSCIIKGITLLPDVISQNQENILSRNSFIGKLYNPYDLLMISTNDHDIRMASFTSLVRLIDLSGQVDSNSHKWFKIMKEAFKPTKTSRLKVGKESEFNDSVLKQQLEIVLNTIHDTKLFNFWWEIFNNSIYPVFYDSNLGMPLYKTSQHASYIYFSIFKTLVNGFKKNRELNLLNTSFYNSLSIAINSGTSNQQVNYSNPESFQPIWIQTNFLISFIELAFPTHFLTIFLTHDDDPMHFSDFQHISFEKSDIFLDIITTLFPKQPSEIISNPYIFSFIDIFPIPNQENEEQKQSSNDEQLPSNLNESIYKTRMKNKNFEKFIQEIISKSGIGSLTSIFFQFISLCFHPFYPLLSILNQEKSLKIFIILFRHALRTIYIFGLCVSSLLKELHVQYSSFGKDMSQQYMKNIINSCLTPLFTVENYYQQLESEFTFFFISFFLRCLFETKQIDCQNEQIRATLKHIKSISTEIIVAKIFSQFSISLSPILLKIPKEDPIYNDLTLNPVLFEKERIQHNVLPDNESDSLFYYFPCDANDWNYEMAFSFLESTLLIAKKTQYYLVLPAISDVLLQVIEFLETPTDSGITFLMNNILPHLLSFIYNYFTQKYFKDNTNPTINSNKNNDNLNNNKNNNNLNNKTNNTKNVKKDNIKSSETFGSKINQADEQSKIIIDEKWINIMLKIANKYMLFAEKTNVFSKKLAFDWYKLIKLIITNEKSCNFSESLRLAYLFASQGIVHGFPLFFNFVKPLSDPFLCNIAELCTNEELISISASLLSISLLNKEANQFFLFLIQAPHLQHSFAERLGFFIFLHEVTRPDLKKGEQISLDKVIHVYNVLRNISLVLDNKMKQNNIEDNQQTTNSSPTNVFHLPKFYLRPETLNDENILKTMKCLLLLPFFSHEIAEHSIDFFQQLKEYLENLLLKFPNVDIYQIILQFISDLLLHQDDINDKKLMDEYFHILSFGIPNEVSSEILQKQKALEKTTLYYLVHKSGKQKHITIPQNVPELYVALSNNTFHLECFWNDENKLKMNVLNLIHDSSFKFSSLNCRYSPKCLINFENNFKNNNIVQQTFHDLENHIETNPKPLKVLHPKDKGFTKLQNPIFYGPSIENGFYFYRMFPQLPQSLLFYSSLSSYIGNIRIGPLSNVINQKQIEFSFQQTHVPILIPILYQYNPISKSENGKETEDKNKHERENENDNSLNDNNNDNNDNDNDNNNNSIESSQNSQDGIFISPLFDSFKKCLGNISKKNNNKIKWTINHFKFVFMKYPINHVNELDNNSLHDFYIVWTEGNNSAQFWGEKIPKSYQNKHVIFISPSRNGFFKLREVFKFNSNDSNYIKADYIFSLRDVVLYIRMVLLINIEDEKESILLKTSHNLWNAIENTTMTIAH